MTNSDLTPIPGSRERRVIALLNQKGGVGKTTTTVNLAAALAEAGHPTLLVDLDPQAHATLHLGHEAPDAGASAYSALLEPEGASAAVIPSRRDLRLMPSLTDLAAAESELASLPDRHERLASALTPMRAEYDFILIDCPPSLGLLTLNALAAADEIIVPMQAHFLALQGLGKLLETVSLVAAEVNPRLRVSGVVLCMHEESTRHAREVVEDIGRFFEESSARDVPWRGARIFAPAIRRNIKLAECPSFGKTVFEYAPECAGAQDYRRLAQAVLHVARERPSEPPIDIVVRRAGPDAPARDHAGAAR